MKASSESGECASLISKVCWEVLEVAGWPDIVVVASSFRIGVTLTRCKSRRPTFPRPQGGELSPVDGGFPKRSLRHGRRDLETMREVAYGARTCVARGRG